MRNNTFLIPLFYILICIFWGTSWLVIKISLEFINPFFNLGLRFLISAAAILIIMFYTETKLELTKESVLIYFLLGFFSYSLPFSLVYLAEKTIPSSLASILFGMYPIFVAILSSIFIKEEVINLPRIAGLLFSFFGLILIFKDGLRMEMNEYFLGMLAIIISAFMQASVAITIKIKGKYLNPLSMNFIPTLIAGVLLTVYSLFVENFTYNKFYIESLVMIFYLAVFVTVFNFTTYYWLLKRMSVVILSLTSFITPVIAVLVGILLGGEKLSVHIVGGAAFVLFGILVVNWEGLKKFYHQRKVRSL